MTLIPDNSFGTIDAFPISARCYVMIVLLGIFHISPLLSPFNMKQCLILFMVVQTGITGEMVIILSVFQLYIQDSCERRPGNNEHLCFVGFPLGLESNGVE